MFNIINYPNKSSVWSVYTKTWYPHDPMVEEMGEEESIGLLDDIRTELIRFLSISLRPIFLRLDFRKIIFPFCPKILIRGLGEKSEKRLGKELDKGLLFFTPLEDRRGS